MAVAQKQPCMLSINSENKIKAVKTVESEWEDVTDGAWDAAVLATAIRLYSTRV